MTKPNVTKTLSSGGDFTSGFTCSRGSFVARVHLMKSAPSIDDKKKRIDIEALLPAARNAEQEQARPVLVKKYAGQTLPLPLLKQPNPDGDTSWTSIVVGLPAAAQHVGRLPDTVLNLVRSARIAHRKNIKDALSPGRQVKGKDTEDIVSDADVVRALMPSIESLVQQQGLPCDDVQLHLRLRAAIDMAGYSYTQLAKAIGVDRSRMAKWAAGTEDITEIGVLQIAQRVLGEPRKAVRLGLAKLNEPLVRVTSGRYDWLLHGGYSWWWADAIRGNQEQGIPSELPDWAATIEKPFQHWIAQALSPAQQELVRAQRAIPTIESTGVVSLQPFTVVRMTPLLHVEEVLSPQIRELRPTTTDSTKASATPRARRASTARRTTKKE